jgi:urease gamma subunit
MIRITFLAFLAILSLFLTGDARAQESSAGRTVTERVTTIREREEVIVERQRAGRPVRLAIMVKNRDADIPDDRVSVFEDYMSARLMDEGFQILRREDVLNAVAGFADAGPNAGDPSLAGAEMDRLLSNNTTAQRLAQSMQAEFILSCTITSFDTEVMEAGIPNATMQTALTTMTVTYNLLNAADGAGFRSGLVDVERRYTATNSQLPRASFDAMLRESARDLAAHVKRTVVDSMPMPLATEAVAFDVICRVANHEVPEVRRRPDGQFELGELARLSVQNVNVFLDGVQIGTAPGTFTAPPGNHKLMLTRAGFEDYTANIRVADGLKLNIDLAMTPEQEARILARARVLDDMKRGQKITDAQVKALEGYATFLEQSGIRIDIRTSETVNRQLTGTVNAERTEKVMSETTEKVQSTPENPNR